MWTATTRLPRASTPVAPLILRITSPMRRPPSPLIPYSKLSPHWCRQGPHLIPSAPRRHQLRMDRRVMLRGCSAYSMPFGVFSHGIWLMTKLFLNMDRETSQVSWVNLTCLLKLAYCFVLKSSRKNLSRDLSKLMSIHAFYWSVLQINKTK